MVYASVATRAVVSESLMMTDLPLSLTPVTTTRAWALRCSPDMVSSFALTCDLEHNIFHGPCVEGGPGGDGPARPSGEHRGFRPEDMAGPRHSMRVPRPAPG